MLRSTLFFFAFHVKFQLRPNLAPEAFDVLLWCWVVISAYAPNHATDRQTVQSASRYNLDLWAIFWRALGVWDLPRYRRHLRLHSRSKILQNFDFARIHFFEFLDHSRCLRNENWVSKIYFRAKNIEFNGFSENWVFGLRSPAFEMSACALHHGHRSQNCSERLEI